MAYEAKVHLKPSNLDGISENQIAQHWKLYEGYVAQSNALLTELDAMRKEGKGGTPVYADRRRRFGFEYNGMVLHEYYFGNLAAGGTAPFAASPGALPFPNPAAMFATLDPAEIERKIGELRVIEGWLQMSLNLMQMSIKTMELQKASLEALRAPPAAPPPRPASSRKKP